MSPDPATNGAPALRNDGPIIDEAEVVVVGGGPSGSVAAAKLAEAGHDVLLVDQSGFPREKPCGDGLTNVSVAFLQRHGLEDLIERSQVIEDVRAVLGHERDATGFYKPWPQPPEYARVTPRETMDSALFDIAIAQEARFRQARVDHAAFEDDGVTGIVLTSGERIAARCVIAADGATSRLRRTSGMAKERQGSRIFALRQYATTQEELEPYYDFHLPLFYEGGLLAGYGWVFPVGHKRANIGVAYYEPPAGREKARIRRVLDSFVDQVQNRGISAERTGELTELTEPIGAPIATQFHPDRCEIGNLIFAGEAARAADALNGEGISFALTSGEFAADEAHRLLTTGRAPAQGARIARRFTRLGVDLTWPARMVAGAPLGLTVADNAHHPYMHRVRRALGFGLDDALGAGTDVSRALAEGDPECAPRLALAEQRITDSLRTSLPFAIETMQREVRAEGGAFAAATAVATARAAGQADDERLASAAAACELLHLANSPFSELSDTSATELGRLSNTLATLTGGLVLSEALALGAAASSDLGAHIAKAARQDFESLAVEAETAPDDGASLELYVDVSASRAARASSIAAWAGGELAGRPELATALAEIGARLGTAWRIRADIRDATTGDEVAGRPPGAHLRAGLTSLPLIYAMEEEPALAGELEGKLDTATLKEVLARVRSSGGLNRAAEECSRQVALARSLIDGNDLADPAGLRALAGLCEERQPVAA